VLDLDLSGLDEYIGWLEKEPARIKLEVTKALHKWALVVHADITRLTPQWSGNLAANWMLDVGAVTSGAEELGNPDVVSFYQPGDGVFGSAPYSRGMQPAVSISLARAKAARLPALGESLYIHNPTTYAEEVEQDSGERPIRAINRVPRTESGKVAMVYHAYTKYSSRPLP